MALNAIFIIGLPRSGTRLLARMLGRSNDCYLITEHKHKRAVPEEKNRISDHEYWDEAFPQRVGEEVDFDQGRFDYLLSLWKQHAGSNRLIIKNPNNVVRAREIRMAFPDAQFVWLVRNPWAVIQSMLGGREAGGKWPMILRAPEALQHRDPMLGAAASWAISIRMMHDLRAPTDVVTTYESLVSNPREELKRICEGLGLSGAIENGAAELPRKGVEDLSWASYLLRRSPERQTILAMIGPLASDFGYPVAPVATFASERLRAAEFFARWVRKSKWRLPYGYPLLERLRRRAT